MTAPTQDWRTPAVTDEPVPYHRTERGREARRRYAEQNRERANEQRRRHRDDMRAVRDPAKIRARELVGNAVRRGYLPKPPDPDRNWHNRWEFHHPDYARPYFGAWVRGADHRAIERGELPAPAFVDYAPLVMRALHADWGFAALAAAEVPA